MMYRLIPLFAILVLAGCADQDGQGPMDIADADDCFSCGWDRADSLSINGYQEVGVLDLVNQASRRMLDDQVGLDSRAADNIVDTRSSNGRFTTLVQLDDVAYVGSRAFGKLVDFAVAHGYVGECGDGEVQDRVEHCDDGNTTEGDGCTASCRLETSPAVHGVAEGSLEGRAILQIVNNASEKTLDDDVALDARAAKNIVAKRPFGTLQELDDVAYVGATAFENLLEYANANSMLCTTDELDELVADINGARWGSGWSREIRPNVSLAEALDEGNWPGYLTHASCFGLRQDEVPEDVTVTGLEDNTPIIRLFQSYAAAARRMGPIGSVEQGMAELTCQTKSKLFAGCRLDFEPGPSSGVTWNIVESTDRSIRYLFVSEWSE